MACLTGLCFALEFCFKPSNLQIISDCSCWKVTISSCQLWAKAEHILHTWGTKCFATALLEIRAGDSASWELNLRGFKMPFSGWCYGGSCWTCLKVGCPCGSTELLSSIPCPGKCSPSESAQVAEHWEHINLHMCYLTGVAGNRQADAQGWEPAEVTPGGGWQGETWAAPGVLGTPSMQSMEGWCWGKTLSKQFQ